jgi:hypothetical protein
VCLTVFLTLLCRRKTGEKDADEETRGYFHDVDGELVMADETSVEQQQQVRSRIRSSDYRIHADLY